MKPAEIYALPVRYESCDELYALEGLSGIPDTWMIPEGATASRVCVKYHAHYSNDGNRIWMLASVWFDGRPCIVLQRAGRSGKDFHREYITDAMTYGELVMFIVGLSVQHDEGTHAVGQNDDISVEFYGRTYEDVVAAQAEQDAEQEKRRVERRNRLPRRKYDA